MAVKPIKVEEGFNKAKAWWKSKTIIGVIITALSYLIQVVFPEVQVDLQGATDEIANSGGEIAQGVDTLWTQMGMVFGSILALYGRVKAKAGIK